jgi:N utilization substance protein A
MLISDIKRVVDQVSREKGIDREVLINALQEALESAARKKLGAKVDIEVQYNEEVGELEVFQFKDVAEVVTEEDLQIGLEEGRKLDPDCQVGDSLGTKIDTSTFGRIAAQSAKQVIIQKMKDAERDAVYASFIDRKGEVINGIVQRFDRNDLVVNLGHTEGILPYKEQVPRENYRRGDRVRAYIHDVLYETRGPQIILSRTHPNFLINLFQTEVPEISEGIVSIMGAAREPGVRAKIAVASNDSDIDPVGACVGMKGSRVQNVVQELKGEKIDIISYHIDSAKFVCNALAPAEISRVIIDEQNRSMEVIVPDEFLSIAIGKKGQNVRLASKLTKWHLDVTSESRYSAAMQDGYNSLTALSGVGISLADVLYEKGFYSAEELSHAAIEDLVQIRGIGQEKAKKLIETAKDYLVNIEKIEAASIEAEPDDAKDSDTGETAEKDIAEGEDAPARVESGEADAEDADTGETAEKDTAEGEDAPARVESGEADAEDSDTGEAAEKDAAEGEDAPARIESGEDDATGE